MKYNMANEQNKIFQKISKILLTMQKSYAILYTDRQTK